LRDASVLWGIEGVKIMDLAIMIEGQNGLNWARWQRLARAVEELGFAGLYRSDHFTNPQPPNLDSLELWVSLTWLASHTQRIQFGPLVTPASFRDPVFTARIAMQVDDLSGGRLQLGLGAGWQEREHEMFGYSLLSTQQRFERFQESLEVISKLMMYGDEPVSFAGDYYQLKDAVLLPKSSGTGHPPVIIGGNGPKYTLPLVARYGAEWNGVYLTPDRFADLSGKLDTLLEQAGRQPKEVRRSLMTNLIYGHDENDLQRKLKGRTRQELLSRGILVGTSSQVLEQLGQYAGAGAQRIMLQWLDLDDLDGLEDVARSLLPQV
jgi:F420-dependent oxidoreductase-like protein